ncbi:ABC transporter ATP-binding protein (plasmid) [Bradyrhizobium sp. 62B]|uniref:ABC transporter ATP-binding protein n=1 Tax=Bradyrhizobium sp. 62B TaxID=2898442 RepID=UPI00255818C9|nr:ABC transporter ATP-binding protein [Bradyrhizobium sp. 62B]
MAGLSIIGLSKGFGSVKVLKDLSLQIKDGEFLTILGPSGCGKSTLLKILAGLETADAGSIFLGDKQLDGVRPKHRNVAMVFQSYALYPHMTAAENVALPLRMRRLNVWQRLPGIGALLPGVTAASEGIAADVSRVAVALGLDELLHRKPMELSGGQRQRVALGRAIVREPAVFLMDEPLSNLDAKLRIQMRAEIKELHRRLGSTFIYVTHDQTEAMTLSDRIVIMSNGEILQVARPQDTYADPSHLRVAEFVGFPKINIVEALVVGGHIEVAGTPLRVDGVPHVADRIFVGIRPESVLPAEPGALDALSGRVRLVEHMGSDALVHLELPGAADLFVARLSLECASRIQIGESLRLHLQPELLLFFDSGGHRIRPVRPVTQIERRAFA